MNNEINSQTRQNIKESCKEENSEQDKTVSKVDKMFNNLEKKLKN